MDRLLNKYLRALISYEGIQRVETYPVPEEALREAVLNAVDAQRLRQRRSHSDQRL